MSSTEDKSKHRRRLQLKKKDTMKKILSKERTKGTVTDKKGKEHDLNKMTHLDLVLAISEDSN